MKNKILIISILALATACSKVPAGYVGIKVNLLGGEKGVESQEVGVGRYWIGWNEELYLFPTFTQNYTWENKDRISFQTIEGLSVSSSIGISYSIDRTKVTTLFQKYRKGIDEITDLYLRNIIRDAFVLCASTRTVETVYGSGKSILIKEVQEMVSNQVKEIGINVEKIYFVGELILPETVLKALNSKIEATQRAQQRENEVAEATAQANKDVAIAEGKLKVAELEAKSIKAKSLSLNENALKLRELENQQNYIEKWNGVLPQTVLGDKTIMMLNK